MFKRFYSLALVITMAAIVMSILVGCYLEYVDSNKTGYRSLAEFSFITMLCIAGLYSLVVTGLRMFLRDYRGHAGPDSVVTQALDLGLPQWETPLPKGTLLATYCDGTTLMERFADGKGGHTNQVRTVDSVECGHQRGFVVLQ